MISIPLMFSSCEKEEEEEEEETQSNNNNNNSDIIIGDWTRYSDVIDPTSSLIFHLTFYSNNTYEDYYIENGSMEELIPGTWENLGGGEYYLDYLDPSWGGGETLTPIFYCDENVLIWNPLHPKYWIKNNYDVQSCSEIDTL